jgi:hypothetical protein
MNRARRRRATISFAPVASGRASRKRSPYPAAPAPTSRKRAPDAPSHACRSGDARRSGASESVIAARRVAAYAVLAEIDGARDAIVALGIARTSGAAVHRDERYVGPGVARPARRPPDDRRSAKNTSARNKWRPRDPNTGPDSEAPMQTSGVNASLSRRRAFGAAVAKPKCFPAGLKTRPASSPSPTSLRE